MFPPDRDLIHPDAGPRENAARYIRGAIDAAAALGSQTLSGPLYASVGRAWRRPPTSASATSSGSSPRSGRSRRTPPTAASGSAWSR